MAEIARKIDAVIYDLDGTLADSGEVNLAAMATVLRHDPLNAEELERLRNSGHKKAMKNLGVRRRHVPGLLLRGRGLANQSLEDIDAFEGITEAVRGVGEKGHRQFVLSSNSPANIEGFLGRHGLDDVMEGIVGDVDMFKATAPAKQLITT